MAAQSNKERLTKTLSQSNSTENDIDLILAERPGLRETDFSASMYKNATYKSMSEILPVANISEGGFSLSWNMDALEMWYNALCKKFGKENILSGKPRVRNRSSSW